MIRCLACRTILLLRQTFFQATEMKKTITVLECNNCGATCSITLEEKTPANREFKRADEIYI